MVGNLGVDATVDYLPRGSHPVLVWAEGRKLILLQEAYPADTNQDLNFVSFPAAGEQIECKPKRPDSPLCRYFVRNFGRATRVTTPEKRSNKLPRTKRKRRSGL